MSPKLSCLETIFLYCVRPLGYTELKETIIQNLSQWRGPRDMISR